MQSATSYTALRNGWAYLAIGISIAMALLSTPWTFAEEAMPEDPGVPVVVENPVPPANPAPTDPPIAKPPVAPEPKKPPVTEPPSVPEPEPTVNPPVEPTSVPDAPIVPVPIETIPAVTEEVQPEVAPEPTSTPTPSPTPEPTATPSPTPEPSPTPSPEPTPVVIWSQTDPVSCVLRDGQPAGLEYAESRTYRCEVSANVTSDLAMPDDMEIEWTVGVSFPDSHVLQFLSGSQASLIHRAPNGTSTRYTITHPWLQGDEQKLAFELVVTRTTCAVGEQALTIQANPQIDTRASDAEIKRQNGNTQPKHARLVSPVIDSESPSLAFDGPITFDALSATSSGLESEISRGSATIIVTGEWDPCTTWTINLSGTVDVPVETPAQLHAVSINNEHISEDACDLSAPCDVIVLPQSGSAATPLRYSIGLELHLHEFTPVGNFSIGITSDIHGEGNLP